MADPLEAVLDFFDDAVGSVGDGGAYIGKAAGLVWGTTEGLFKGFKGFLEGLL